jgi:hypothetical protein
MSAPLLAVTLATALGCGVVAGVSPSHDVLEQPQERV